MDNALTPLDEDYRRAYKPFEFTVRKGE
jgi:hypothetical protein